MNPRLRAVCDLSVPDVRESAGRHEYDGAVQDLSPAGVRAGLAKLGHGSAEPEPHDEAHLAAAEAGLLAWFARAEMHRRNPLVHLDNLDLSPYDREYAPEAERAEARRSHLGAWPAAVDAAVESLDQLPAPVARALLRPLRGLADGLPDAAGEDPLAASARRAHQRLVDHVAAAAESGPQEAALGPRLLAELMGAPEALVVDLPRLEERVDTERGRLRERLVDSCSVLRPGFRPEDLPGLLHELDADHPDPEGIYREAREQISELTAFVRRADLLPELGGECLVGPAPASRRWAMAMMSWAAPGEADAPAWYHVNPPDPAWSEEEQEQWLAVFSRTTLPAITAHEVMPGHFAHSRLLRRAAGDVRRTLFSSAFVEGWAHYTEELMVESGFRRHDPRFAIGVWLEALTRVTRLAVALGVHAGTMTLAEAVQRFEQDALIAGPAARAEAERALFDPTYGRYTWGKLEILALRDEAEARWGLRYTHRRFHEALLALGAPPLGLMGDVLGGP